MSAPDFIWPIRVYYEDTDVSGVVYHAAYLCYLERARTEWLRAQGYSQEQLRTELGVAFTVSELEIRFRKPARLDDALEATVTVSGRGRASLEFEQSLRFAGDPGQVLTTARVRVACVDAHRFKPCALPGRLLQPRQATSTATST
ncbi:MAG: tol-pal system-associated acyl-CoA thioesterase [Nevskia sp.]|nr:tol-pal system-associated acyl-CoA thioesterase [Nevskia sp.]